ncbi:SOS response-associated peptidase family protein (plasmid) [Haloferax prahovense]|uniref:SOS response-associated peptidase family protein n=1 Tax=Haloferax prahovense TaxID=381852 RepID=UPI003C730D5D
MPQLIADASALVSLGIVTGDESDPLALCLSQYEVVVPTAVIDELREIASYDDVHGHAASAVLDQTGSFTTQSVELDAEFPLDDGENAAVTLANELDAALFLCDEFNQPYRIYREDDPAFAMAGLWNVWEGDDETTSCVTILTTEPNDLMNSIHDRMPVVLPQDAESDWLAADPDTRKELCQPYPKDDLDTYEISTRVNNPGNDEPQVIEPLDHEQSGLGEFSS